MIIRYKGDSYLDAMGEAFVAFEDEDGKQFFISVTEWLNFLAEEDNELNFL